VANRDRHRQGLVYGPVRPSGPRDRGRIVGNLLGFLVVVVTVSVLILAIYFFIQSRSAEAPPMQSAPAASAFASPSATASLTTSVLPSASAIAAVSLAPTLAPSGPTPLPTAVATPVNPATPGPTLFVPSVMQGSGFITFGTTADAQFHILDARTTFSADEPILWSAYMTEVANSSDLRIRVLKLDASQPSGQLLVREEAVTPRADGIRIFFHRFRLNGSGPGLYTIQYVKGEDILSTGSFLVQ
jgi:hypothetical protein